MSYTADEVATEAWRWAYSRSGVTDMKEIALLEAENVHPYIVKSLRECRNYSVEEMVAIRGIFYKRGLFPSEAIREFYRRVGEEKELGELGEKLLDLHLTPITTARMALQHPAIREQLESCGEDQLRIVVTLVEEQSNNGDAVTANDIEAYILAFS